MRAAFPVLFYGFFMARPVQEKDRAVRGRKNKAKKFSWRCFFCAQAKPAACNDYKDSIV